MSDSKRQHLVAFMAKLSLQPCVHIGFVLFFVFFFFFWMGVQDKFKALSNVSFSADSKNWSCSYLLCVNGIAIESIVCFFQVIQNHWKKIKTLWYLMMIMGSMQLIF